MVRKEIPRQLVHLSGLVMVMLSLHLGRWLSALSFLIVGLFFLLYLLYLRSGREPGKGPLGLLERGLRWLVMRLERGETPDLSGPIWFYLGLFLTYALFPLYTAFLAGVVLSVGDSLATISGRLLRGPDVLPGKSLSGIAAFLAGSILSCLLFSPPLLALAASVGGCLGELLPALWGRPRIDDNLSIPLLSALSVSLALVMF